MTKRLLSLFALTALQSVALFAQTFTGTWQGALSAPQAPRGELRVVIRISTTDADQLAAQFYSIDQDGQPIIATTVTAAGSDLRIAVEQINGVYEGRLSADGKSIAGTWTQGAPRPMALTRATPETAWTIPDPLPPPKMMDPRAAPEFEVATIRPSDPNRTGWGITVNRSGILTTLNTTLADLVKFAYDIHPKQVTGPPSWFDTDRFDLSAKPDTPGIPAIDQMKAMLRKLLAERFSLTFHNEKRELSAYAITVAKGGEKIKKEENATLPVPGFGGRPQSGFNIRNATIAEFASVMQAQFMDQPVVDQTGLGVTRYSFILKFTPDPGMRPFGAPPPAVQPPPPAPEADAPPDLFSAMEQQLGLRLQKTRASVDVMVVDKVEKPSDN